MKIGVGYGRGYLEPDEGPRNSPYHMRIVHVQKIPNTRAGNSVLLQCGHTVQTFGDLTHAAGVILCTKCRDLSEGANG